jgi:hypothetical protein
MKKIETKWVLIAVEVIIATLLLFFIGFVLFGLVFAANPETSKVARILDVLNNDWKALLIIVLIPFYYPIYTFLANLIRVTLPGGTTLERGEKTQPPTLPPPTKPPNSNGGLQ